MFSRLARFFSSDIGIDLGTANCLVYVKNCGIVFSEPSVVAVKDDKVLKIGMEAKRTIGRCPVGIQAVRPMKQGGIADPSITEEMLRYFIQRAKTHMLIHQRLIKPTVLIAVPSGLTEVLRRAVEDSAQKAGAGKVITIEEPVAAAIGVGLPTSEPTGSMIVDIGGGTTEVAIISIEGIVASKSCPVGGDNMDAVIIKHMQSEHNLIIGERTAEDVKIRIGSAFPVPNLEESMEVRGRDRISGLPKAHMVTAEEIREALAAPIATIQQAIHETLEKCPPELAGDLIDRGIMLAGGGALIPGMADLLSRENGIPVFVSEDPLKAVARGTGIVLQELDRLTQ